MSEIAAVRLKSVADEMGSDDDHATYTKVLYATCDVAVSMFSADCWTRIGYKAITNQSPSV